MSNENLPPKHYWHRNLLINLHYSQAYIDRYLDQFQFRENDIVVVTYPRNGTLLTQEIIWQIKHRHEIKAGDTYGPLTDRFPYIELFGEEFDSVDYIDILEKKPESEQRFIKTHMPKHAIFDRIKNCKKIVIVYRDAKDVATSLYHFYKIFPFFEDWPASWEEYFPYFIEGRIIYGSYFEWISEWLKVKHLQNIHLIKYEDIVKDKAAEIRKLSIFLDEAEITDDQIDIIIRNTSFDSMFANKEVNNSLPLNQAIMRKGIVGDHKNYVSEEQKEKFDALTKEFITPFES